MKPVQDVARLQRDRLALDAAGYRLPAKVAMISMVLNPAFGAAVSHCCMIALYSVMSLKLPLLIRFIFIEEFTSLPRKSKE
jgi:hypothetical protein